MTERQLIPELDEIRALPKETEWIEFKHNKSVNNKTIGEYISALSNSACLHNQPFAYMVWGIEDGTHKIVGTSFSLKKAREGNQELEFWLMLKLNPKIDFSIYEFYYGAYKISLLKIPAAANQPIKFNGIAYVRIGSSKTELKNHPEKERKIWLKNPSYDWSIHICNQAKIRDLNKEALKQAKEKFKEINKNKSFYREIDNWDTATFLDKAQITKDRKITNAAIVLLGNPESTHFLSPGVAQITWKLDTTEHAYEHFGPPLFLNVNNVYKKIRDIKHKILPGNTLIPIEVNKYDAWIILEALNNCIAHQDYSLQSRIILTETDDRLTFSNAGSFFEGTIEDYTINNKTPGKYRNSFLVNAMRNLAMIDAVGYGIKKMFQLQRDRYFPMPDYDLSDPGKVILTIHGHILNENYTKILIEKKNIDLKTIILLDKIQKQQPISKDEATELRKNKLVEGRYPKLYIASQLADIKKDKPTYIKNKAFDDQYYKDLIVKYLKIYKQANRDDIDRLIMDKLSDVLDYKQKRKKINNLLYAMSKKEGIIRNIGTTKKPDWILTSVETS
jgi:ATP-dependent DNA helicase RecG